jgi:hypothetical protein
MPVTATAPAEQPGVGLRFQNHQKREHCRQDQHHSNQISLHQKYLLELTGIQHFYPHLESRPQLFATQFAATSLTLLARHNPLILCGN